MTFAGPGPAEPRGRRRRWHLPAARRIAAAALVALIVVTGCGPSPSPSASPSPSPSSTPRPADDGQSTLSFAVARDPSGFLPPARDPDSARIQGFLFDGLYRLDDALRPVPVLAAELPRVSKDGKTWTIPIREGVTFSDGSPLDPADVVTTLQLARSPDCPFGDACRLAADHLQGVKAAKGAVVLTLTEPWSPLLATLLADLPILPADALAASLERVEAGARAVDRKALAASITDIEAAVNAVACDEPAAPATCSPADHVVALTDWLRLAGAVAPRPERFADAAGEVDRVAYGSALIAAVDAMADVLGRPDAPATPRPTGNATPASIDRLATALPLLDLAAAPVGTGPYRLKSYGPGVSVVLERRDPAPAGVPQRVEAVVLRDPTEAATAIQSGRIDWLPSVAPEMVPVLEPDASLIVGARPSGAERVIVFNVRDGHPYADPVARQAFARCLDREALVEATLARRGLPASALVAPGSWAAVPARSHDADPEAARTLLEEAGYVVAGDGTYQRDGQRLSSEIAIRPGRAELSALMSDVADALDACGIELTVREVPFSPDVVLPLLEWPNDFETYLATVSMSADPAIDLAWLDGARVTTEDNPGDANFGGWQDKATDQLLAAGRSTLDEERRRSTYAELQARIEELVPAWPLVHEPAYAAVSTGVQRDGATIDPGLPGYERGLGDWRLAAP